MTVREEKKRSHHEVSTRKNSIVIRTVQYVHVWQLLTSNIYVYIHRLIVASHHFGERCEQTVREKKMSWKRNGKL